jgi:hypothetical protein
MPRQLRNMFAIILIYGEPSNALSLWTYFKEHLSYRLMSSVCAEDICLTFLARKLEPFGLNLSTFGLPQPRNHNKYNTLTDDYHNEHEINNNFVPQTTNTRIGGLLRRLNNQQSVIL